jgi:hypothetical protein
MEIYTANWLVLQRKSTQSTRTNHGFGRSHTSSFTGILVSGGSKNHRCCPTVPLIGVVGAVMEPTIHRRTAMVGIEMGAAGTNTILERADITLLSDGLTKLPYLVGLPRTA